MLYYIIVSLNIFWVYRLHTSIISTPMALVKLIPFHLELEESLLHCPHAARVDILMASLY